MTTELKVGDKVRSYDFDGRKDCYVDGTLTEVQNDGECDRYAIKVEAKVWCGVLESDFPEFVYPPVNGLPNWLGGVTAFVEPL